MKLLRRITAAGLAGCMLLMAIIPETAAIAVFAEESAESTYTFNMPVSNIAGPGQILVFPFEIVNHGGTAVDKIEYQYELTEDFTVIQEEIIPETKYSEAGKSLLMFRVQVADDVKLEMDEFRLQVNKIMDADGNDLTDGLVKVRPSVTMNMTEGPYEAGETSVTLAQGEKKNVRIELVADKDADIRIGYAGGKPLQPGSSYSVSWYEWFGKYYIIDGKQHLFMVVTVTAQKNSTPGTYHESFDFSGFFKDAAGNKVDVTASDLEITVTAAENVTDPTTNPTESHPEKIPVTDPTKSMTEPTEAPAPTAFETIDLKFGTPTLITKEIGGDNIKFSGVFAVSGPSKLDIQNTDDAAIIAELKGYVLEAVQYAVMGTDFTAENYTTYLHEIRRSAADYFAERGYNKKTAFTLTSISIVNMTVSPDETATLPTDATAPVSDSIQVIVPEIPELESGEDCTIDLKIINNTGEPIAKVYGGRMSLEEGVPFHVSLKDMIPEPDKDNSFILPVTIEVTGNVEPGTYTGTLNLAGSLADEELSVHKFKVDDAFLKVTVKSENKTDPTEDPSEPRFPYTIIVPATKTVKPGDEVDVRFRITNDGDLPLASFYCDWFCNMGLCPENVTVKITPEAENKETANESLIDIHFTVGSNALAGVYPFGINVTDLWDTKDNVVISKLFKGSESMTLVVKLEDAAKEPTAPTQIYNVLFPKAGVKQGESKEIKLSILHNTTTKYLSSIKAGSYTADGLTFTWEAMALDDKENSSVSIPMTVSAAADATPGVHRYYVPLENVLVNEDDEIVSLSSLAFERHSSIMVDQGSGPIIAEKPSIELKLPEIPATAPGEKYEFEAEMILSAAGDFRAVKSGLGIIDDCFRYEWGTVLFDKEGQTSYKIPFTVELADTAKGSYEAKLPEHMYVLRHIKRIELMSKVK